MGVVQDRVVSFQVRGALASSVPGPVRPWWRESGPDYFHTVYVMV